MALQRPLYIDNDNNLRIMDEVHLDRVRTEAVRQFALGGFIDITYDSAGGGFLGDLEDTRLRAGAATTDTRNFDTEAETPEPTTLTTTYNFLNQGFTSSSGPEPVANGFPLYWNGTHVQSMTEQDFIDTIVEPAIDRLATSSLNESDGAGTYFVSTLVDDPLGNRVAGSPIFSDTRADSSAYSAGSIPESIDQPQTITDYYLYEVPAPQEQDYPKMVYGTETGDIHVYDKSDFQLRLRQKVAERSLATLSYAFDSSGGPGANKGSALVNTRLSGTTGLYRTRFVNSNDYRTQEFPFGVAETQWTQYLKLRKSS